MLKVVSQFVYWSYPSVVNALFWTLVSKQFRENGTHLWYTFSVMLYKGVWVGIFVGIFVSHLDQADKPSPADLNGVIKPRCRVTPIQQPAITHDHRDHFVTLYHCLSLAGRRHKMIPVSEHPSQWHFLQPSQEELSNNSYYWSHFNFSFIWTLVERIYILPSSEKWQIEPKMKSVLNSLRLGDA